MIFKKGSGLVEVLVGGAVMVVIFTGLISAYNSFIRANALVVHNVKASYLAEEGIEAVRQIKNSSWTQNISTITNGSNYYMNFSSGKWTLSSSPQSFIDGIFERKIIFYPVYRDSNDDIASSGTLDPNTKKISSVVSFSALGATSTISVSAYITNVFDN